MHYPTFTRDFDSWRSAARLLLARDIPPTEIFWPDNAISPLLPLPSPPSESIALYSTPAVPREYLSLARMVACHRDPERWPVLYRILWRLTHAEPDLLAHITDDDLLRARSMEKSVHRDRHKMTAFVRFRLTQDEFGDHYVAFHRPDHFIVKLASAFFKDRFASMRWTILTPDDCVTWDGHQLCFGPGVPASCAPAPDALETLWRTYYANIFNPARIKLDAMRKEMPVRHWKTLPETQLIPELLRDAPRRVEQMLKASNKLAAPSSSTPHCDHAASAAEFLPAKITLPQLIDAAKECRGCPLYCNATQIVFGAGPATAKIIFVGEQPGDQEDLQGKPFVGPAGQLLDTVLVKVGIDREQAYVTNAVKHFKWTPRGKRRLHATPTAREVAACKPWLEAEIKAIRPKMIVALGATAARALFGNQFRVTHDRGKPIDSPLAGFCLATIHPSAILRTPHELREQALADFTADLKVVADALRSS